MKGNREQHIIVLCLYLEHFYHLHGLVLVRALSYWIAVVEIDSLPLLVIVVAVAFVSDYNLKEVCFSENLSLDR